MPKKIKSKKEESEDEFEEEFDDLESEGESEDELDIEDEEEEIKTKKGAKKATKKSTNKATKKSTNKATKKSTNKAIKSPKKTKIVKKSPKQSKKVKELVSENISESNITEKAKKDLMLPKNGKSVFKSAISPSRSQPKMNFKQSFSSEMRKADIPNVDATVKSVKIPIIEIAKNESVSITPKGNKTFKENKETVVRVLKEIKVMMLAKEEGSKKTAEYNLTQLKFYINKLGLPQNADRNTSVRKILEQLRNYDLISIEDQEIINKRLKDKERKKTLLMSKKKN